MIDSPCKMHTKHVLALPQSDLINSQLIIYRFPVSYHAKTRLTLTEHPNPHEVHSQIYICTNILNYAVILREHQVHKTMAR